MSNCFSCKNIGWCCSKKNKEPEIEVEQGDQITFQSCSKVDTCNNDNLIQRTNCFFITREKKKVDQIKKITVKKSVRYKEVKGKCQHIEGIASQLQNTEQSIKYLHSAVE